MKRFAMLLLALALCLALCVPALAAGAPSVTYNGTASLVYADENGNALSGNGSFGSAFSSLIPGVTSTQQIVLRNTSTADTVRFYMTMDVLKTLKAAALDGASYDVVLSTSTQTLFSSVKGSVTGSLIGGSGSSLELAELNSALLSKSGNGILVATLAPGASETLTLSITPSATMSNAYQGGTGTLSFQFFAEKNDPKGNTVTIYVPGQTITKVVKTGESSIIYAVAGIMLLAVVVLAMTGRRKKNEKEDG